MCVHLCVCVCVCAAQRAPSSFNAQPYRMVVVRGEEAKQRLAGAMLGGNQAKVATAGATVVFAADLGTVALLCVYVSPPLRAT